MGNCGVGFAPVRPDKHEWLIALMEGVEDIPGTALHEGITWGWESFPEYLDVLDRGRYAIDVGAQVPHAALRGYVMGDRGADHDEVPTADEIATMGRLAAEAIEAGALGLHDVAHGRAPLVRRAPHPESHGDRPTSCSASPARSARPGRASSRSVADLVDLDAEFELIRAMAEVSGRPLSLTTLQRPEFAPDEYRRILGLIEAAVADGVEIRGQVAARPVGLDPAARRTRAPAPCVADVPVARGAAAARAGSRAAPARGAREDPRGARRAGRGRPRPLRCRVRAG